ncbi:MAG: thymidylate synthase [Bacteroidia bacterium]|nr:thymidylate synthase [Bacteroidia bacterium]
MNKSFTLPSFETLDDFLHQTYSHIIENGHIVKGKRGSIKEINNFAATLENPRARTSHSLERRLVISKFAEFAWYLSGEADLEFIKPYISDYKKEDSKDGKVLGAYGPRIFGTQANGISQFERICDQIRSRPETKQAYLLISESSDFRVRENPHSSPPCTIGLHFILRNDRLNLTTFMRSNDAFFGLPHDVFCFTMLQEMVAVKLGFEIGHYSHICTSMHIYEKFIDNINDYLNEGLFDPLNMPSMPTVSDDIIRFIISAFRNKGKTQYESEIPPYWADYALFSKKKYSKESPEDWLSLFQTEGMKSIAANSLNK